VIVAATVQTVNARHDADTPSRVDIGDEERGWVAATRCLNHGAVARGAWPTRLALCSLLAASISARRISDA
jgi:hypothetical protein